ncbi:MAG: anti-sigma factor [Chitinophagaceae bacterium]|nr:anti-sigma factor [Anaerolineae bacterium]
MNMTDPDEVRFIESSLASCPEAAAELAEYQRLAEAFLDSAPQVQAPPHLAYRLIEQANATKAIVMTQGAPKNHKRRSVSRIVFVAWGIAAALIIVMAGWVMNQTQLRGELASEVALQNDVIALLSSGEAVSFAFAPVDDTTSIATGVVLCHPDLDVGIVRVENFPPPPEGSAYQVWLRKGEERYNGGLFQTNSEGRGTLVFRAPGPMSEIQYVGITLEPASGSPSPTTPAVVRAKLY